MVYPQWIRLIALLTLLNLTSCTSLQPSAIPQEPTWEKQQAALTRIRDWSLEGKIAVITPQQSGSATIHWQQQGDDYRIALLAPLGSGGLTLTGKPGTVNVITHRGEQLQAKSPEALLKDQWGWDLPMSSLHYWIRGLPVPSIPNNSQFDAHHRLRVLHQQGFTVQYLNYTSVGTLTLPNKITLTSPTLKTKMIIYTWNVPIAH